MMKIFDFNIHLPNIKNDDVNVVIHQDLNLEMADVVNAFKLHSAFINTTAAGNFLLFNTGLFNDYDGVPLQKKIRDIRKEDAYTALIDFRRYDLYKYLDSVRDAGVNAIMFNSYLQKISEQDFTEVYAACRYAEENRMIICIDGSYGTSKMYNYDNMKLACFVADLVTKVPVVIIHSGGRRILEAMLLAADKRNVWLDTSFSLPYYIGSSLEKDYAIAYKKIGTRRVVYGSDYPYENSMEALAIHIAFFERHGFAAAEIDNILYNNARDLFSNV